MNNILIIGIIIVIIASSIFIFHNQIENSLKNIIHQKHITTQTINVTFNFKAGDYKFGHNELRVILYKNGIKMSNKLLDKNGNVIYNMSKFMSYNLDITNAYSFIPIYNKIVNYMPYNHTYETIILQQRALLLPLKFNSDKNLTIKHFNKNTDIYLNINEKYKFNFNIKTIGKGIYDSPYIEFKSKIQPMPYIHIDMEYGTLLQLPDKVILNKKYTLAKQFNEKTYSDLILNIGGIENEGNLTMVISDKENKDIHKVNFIFE